MARVSPLTNTEVKQAKPKDKVYLLADGAGLQLRVKPNGSKLWQLRYTNPYTKKPALMGFGAYPAVSLKEARKLRESAKELLARGLNPKAERDEEKNRANFANNNTLLHIAKEWIKVKKGDVSEDYAIDVWRSLENHIFPTLGNVPIHKLTAPQVINVIRPLEAKGTLDVVKRVCSRINEVMDFATNAGIIPNNPLSKIRVAFSKPKSKHLPTIKPNELPELMSALNTASIKIITRCLIEFQLHTMTRPSEAAEARWEEIDEENRLWTIPKERMKMDIDHVIPLTDQVMTILEFIKPISRHREYLFPADRNPKKHTCHSTANTAISRMGFKGVLVAHGMRSIGSTAFYDEGRFNSDVIEACLAHGKINKTVSAYNRSNYLQPRTELMPFWSDFISDASKNTGAIADKKLFKNS